MKKVLVIVIVIGLLGSYLVPMFMNESKNTEAPFQFGFSDNLAIKFGDVVTIPIETNGEVKNLSITFAGKVIQKFAQTKEKLSIQLDSKKVFGKNHLHQLFSVMDYSFHLPQASQRI